MTSANQMKTWLNPLTKQHREMQKSISEDPYLEKFKVSTKDYIEFMNKMHESAHPDVQKEEKGILYLDSEKYIGQFSWDERNFPFGVMPVSFEDREILVKLSGGGMNSALYIPRDWYEDEAGFRKNFESWVIEQNHKAEKKEELDILNICIQQRFGWMQIDMDLINLGEGNSLLVTLKDIEKVSEEGMKVGFVDYTMHELLHLLFDYGQVNGTPIRRDDIETHLIRPLSDVVTDDILTKARNQEYLNVLGKTFAL